MTEFTLQISMTGGLDIGGAYMKFSTHSDEQIFGNKLILTRLCLEILLTGAVTFKDLGSV